MLFFSHLRPVFTGLCFIFAVNSVFSSAHAARPSQGDGASCFSSKELNQMAKAYLVELQLIDPNLALSDVKTVLKESGNCASIEELDAAIAQYSANLANSVPVISGSPQPSIVKGGFYIFTPTASDTDGDTLVFSVNNLPSWAYFDSNTGTILGIPMDADVGIHSGIEISVSDGIASSNLTGIAIEVVDTNTTAPNPLLGEIASYSVHLGTSVDDLSNVISLDLSNSAQVQANSTLSSANTYYLAVIPRNRDGNTLLLPETEIAGFRIYIGDSIDNMTPLYNFDDGTQKVYWVNNLLAGTYFVAITTYDINGNETPLSNIVQFNMI